jgi:hypothetical protein
MRPQWCPHSECVYKASSQDLMCVGRLPEPVLHGETPNTHRVCINTIETGQGIFDLQLNWTDSWNLIRLLNLTKNE